MFRNNTSIRRKLIVMILLTSAAVLLLSFVALITYDFVSFRQVIARNVATLGQVIAANSAAALAFENKQDAREILNALKAERHIVAAGLYDARGALLATYPADLPPGALPSSLEADGYYFEHAALVGLEPVHQGAKRFGTLYLKSDLQALYERLRIYSGIAAAVIAVSFFVAYLLSRMFQRQISRPILALSDTARAVSDRRDYSVRAPFMGSDELGLLTDTFNQMLTQIQQQDRTVRDSEARVRAVLNSAISAVIVIDVNGKIIDWNPRAERIFGWTRAEALGEELAELIVPPDYQQGHRRGLQHFQATGEGPVLNRLIELSALRRDGTEFPVELSVSPMNTGGAVTFCGFITDITERKREEKTRAQLAAIVESSEDAIISKTLDGVITSWNPGAEKLFGYAAHECIGQPMLMLFPPERAAEEKDLLSKIVAGEITDHFDTVRVARDGRRADVSVTISPIRDSHGDVVGASTIARDIADRKLADSKLNAQLTRLDLLQRITRAIGDVAQTVSRMREFYRPRESQLALVPTDLNRIVREVIELTRVRWRDVPQERGIVVDLRTELLQPLPSVVGTEGEIRDALTNLIFNAVDAMPEGGVLTVRTRDPPSHEGVYDNERTAVVHLEVSDTGVGMEEETRRHCLEPFFTTKGERGTGLGLAMVYGMVQRHNAELEIDSAPGQGTTVRITFPVALIAADGTSRLPALPALGPLRILVVDDDPLIIESLRAILEGDGYQVTAADGGQAGVDAMLAAQQSAERYSVVITDLGMPYVDGRRVATAVKTSSPATPVILLTGWGQRLVDENEIPVNVDRVLNKPPKLRELRAALAELVTGAPRETP